MPDSLKSKMMGIVVTIITVTLCSLLVIYVGFSMYHKTPLMGEELGVFKSIAGNLGSVIIMWFTAEIIAKRSA